MLTIALHKKAIVISQNPIRLNDYSEPKPDITIAKRKDDFYREIHPTPEDIFLVVEVADSSLGKDREIKTTLYASHSIPEYWIINLADRQFEIHREPKNSAYQATQIISAQGPIACHSIPFEIDYSEVFPKG